MVADQFKSCEPEYASVLLRGFQGQIEGFTSTGPLDKAAFWQDFAMEDSGDSSSVTREQYLEQIEGVINLTVQRKLNKVVLSRQQFEPVDADAQKTFAALLEKYSGCTVFAMIHPVHGSWMGASPEVLLEETIIGFRSMSLAGTRLRGALNWGPKEVEEQQYVTKEVHRALKELGGKVSRQPQETLAAGPVEHLLTWVESDNSALNAVDALERLHPTPAVCGTPTSEALDVILSTEAYDRSLYTGYLAFREPSLWAAVMLRTMRWSNKGITYFAGGGITKDSVPLSEWMETEYKIAALKDAVILR
jgi:isochorismate synthase